jgi:hypothetical protein
MDIEEEVNPFVAEWNKREKAKYMGNGGPLLPGKKITIDKPSLLKWIAQVSGLPIEYFS